MDKSTTAEDEIVYELICDVCKEKNLTEQISVLMCYKCMKTFCIHLSSNVDPQYCTECCHDVQMEEQIVTKTVTHYSDETDKIYSKTFKARQISFSGSDWLFFNRKISTLTDLELGLAIETHRGLLNSMLYERDERRAKYLHRNAGKSNIFTVTDTSVSKTTTTTTKKIKTTSAKKTEKTEANIKAIMQALIAKGLSIDQILAAMKG